MKFFLQIELLCFLERQVVETFEKGERLHRAAGLGRHHEQGSGQIEIFRIRVIRIPRAATGTARDFPERRRFQAGGRSLLAQQWSQPGR